MSEWRHREAIINGLRFHYVSEGEGPLVLLLHGFPELWYSWSYQIPALAAAGFRVVAPDLRGYHLSEKPPALEAYHIDRLVEDCAAMLQRWGGEEGGYLVGHDWGGMIAWYTASKQPERVRKLVILNAPHPNRYLEVLREVARQRLQSFYAGLFQLPFLPEWLLTAGKGALTLRMILASGIRREQFTAEHRQQYRTAISQPGAANAALNYYRSLFRHLLARGFREAEQFVRVPTLLLWGLGDVALHPANAERERLLRWVPELRVIPVEASHWPHIDQPGIVNEQLLAFLGERAMET